ncbi:RNA polymerase subunit sigma [Streptomyces sp. NPDC050625]|uniref:RNA polymerase subunit sigma n=1 Tax=Streptomyces sp. NPDC050625 TaxID=3154629 RepID=UPI00343C2639
MNDRQTVEPIAVLLEERRYLLDRAYELLGSRSAADDAVTETYKRWYALEDRATEALRIWLGETVRTVCLTPAPASDTTLLDDASSAQDSRADASRSSQATLLGDEPAGGTPRRAAGPDGQRVLSEAVAEMARQFLRGSDAGQVTAEQRRAVVQAFRTACQTNDVPLLASLLAPHASAAFDGGGKVRTPDRPVKGARNVTECLASLLAPSPSVTLEEWNVNGQPGLVVRCGDHVAAVISLDVCVDQVINVWLILNPDKLRRLNR